MLEVYVVQLVSKGTHGRGVRGLYMCFDIYLCVI